MIKPWRPLEIFLNPEECCCAGNTRIRPVLGSCVSISLWYSQLRARGMSSLPARHHVHGENSWPARDEYYSDGAIAASVQVGRRLIMQHSVLCLDEYPGHTVYLNVSFDVWSGEVWIRRGDTQAGVKQRKACKKKR